MSDEKELTAEEVCAALNAYDKGYGWSGWRGHTWEVESGKIRTYHLPHEYIAVDDARAIVAGWRAAEELAVQTSRADIWEEDGGKLSDEVRKQDREMVVLREQLDLAANNILCGYCGKMDRKPEPWSADAAMEIILEHLKTCTDHPLNQLLTFTEELPCGHLSALLVLDDNGDPRCSQCWLKEVEAELAALRAKNEDDNFWCEVCQRGRVPLPNVQPVDIREVARGPVGAFGQIAEDSGEKEQV